MKFLILLIILLLTIILMNSKFGMETWQDYTLKPYNYVYSGNDPLHFYRKDRYRRPYRDGFKFYQSYPVPHMSSHL